MTKLGAVGPWGGKKFRKQVFHAAAGFFLLIPQYVLAADIEIYPAENADDFPVIFIEGAIESGDEQIFRRLAVEYDDALVLLNSEGGMIGPALDIGRTIKIKGYDTAVYENNTCASACALIWVAGSSRFVFEGGAIGFHASYLDTEGARLETGVGNALVGHYLSQLGYGQDAVVFATVASPDEILWLNEKTASGSGITFETIPDREARQSRNDVKRPKAPPPIVISPAPPAGRQPGSGSSGNSGALREQEMTGNAWQGLRDPEAFAQALRQRGYNAQVSDEGEAMTYLNVGVGGEEVAIAFSGCSNNICNYIQIVDWFTDITDDEADFISRHVLALEVYSHPFWSRENRNFGFYNYIVLGSSGITIQTLIDNLNYFVRENMRLTDLIVQRRAGKR